MSFTIHGIGVSSGIAIGRAHLLTHTELEVVHYDIAEADIAQEKARFDRAIETARTELGALAEHIPEGAPPEVEGFLDLHLMILGDSTLSEVPMTLAAKANYLDGLTTAGMAFALAGMALQDGPRRVLEVASNDAAGLLDT